MGYLAYLFKLAYLLSWLKLDVSFTGDDEEKKSFRSKGIPVIFQDELEEKPDVGNKSPIILKYEKPPLLPHNNKDGEFIFLV